MGVTFFTTVSALALATVSAGFSITGMTSIFFGAFGLSFLWGPPLEAGKLSAVVWLARHRANTPSRLRIALGTLGLNATGAYAFPG
jgi:hypothetical protein